MTGKTRTGERYATAMGELWTGLARTLRRLEQLAQAPGLLDEPATPAVLRTLQYGLHTAGERAFGLTPPAPAAEVHADLAAALALARDLTAEVADAAELGGAAAVEPLLPEWRGALFRVRLARRRFAQRSAAPSPPVDAAADDSLARPLIAFLLAFFGALAVVAGAATAVWEIWSAGLVAVLGSVLAYRP